MAGIGFFAPLPLALMLPFMAGQSMIMGEAFGKSYQYGKRKISSMSNEEFNKLSPKDLANEIMSDYNNIVPALSNSVKASSEFQSTIIKELVDVVKNLPQDLIFGLVGTSDPSGNSNIGAGAAGIIGGGNNDPLAGFNAFFETLAKSIGGVFQQSPAADFYREQENIVQGANAPPVVEELSGAEKRQAEIVKQNLPDPEPITPLPNAQDKEFIDYIGETSKLFNLYRRELNFIEVWENKLATFNRVRSRNQVVINKKINNIKIATANIKTYTQRKNTAKTKLYNFWRVKQNSRNSQIKNHAARNYKTRLP